MTLILGMSKAEGIYMSADFRVSQGRQVVDDASVKLVDVLFAGGTRGLLGYTGLAVLPDGTSMGTWLVETIRGESEVPDVAMAHLLSRLNRDIAPLQTELIVSALLIEGRQGERRLFGGLSNVAREPGSGRLKRLDAFGYAMTELQEPFGFANGSGAAKVIADGHMARLGPQLQVRPRRALDHMNLLASINRTVAAKASTVSPACHVAFVPAEVVSSRFEPISRSFTREGESAPLVMPFILSGIDTSSMMRELQEGMKAMARGEEPVLMDDLAEIEKRTRRRN